MKKVEIFSNPKDTDERDHLKDLKEISNYKREQQNKKSSVVVEFPTWMLIAILLIVCFIFFGKQLLTIAVFVFAGFIVMSALKPIIQWLMNRRISKGWSVAITYILLFCILVGISSLIIVPFGKGIQEMVNMLPSLVSNFLEDFKSITVGSLTIDKQWFVDLTSGLTSLLTPSGGIEGLKSLAGTVGGVINWTALFFAVIIFSVYLISESEKILQLGLLRISNDRKRARVKKLVEDVEDKLGRWLMGQLTVSTIAGVVLGTALSLLSVPFALPLGVIVGLLNTIPSLGTTLAIIPSVLVALISGGWTKALVVLAVYVVYQQIENNILVPRIMGNAVGLKPIIVMLGVMIFLILFGGWGAVLAVPIMVLLKIFYEFYIDLQKLEAEGIV
jgi:predicted PurR-regulated permease PerM